MRIIDNTEDFLAEVESRFGLIQAFEPTVTHIPAGDCIEFIARPGRYRAQRLDDLVTVYLSEENDEIVGSLIKGVSSLYRQLAEKYPGFKITVEDGRVRLEHLFLAHLWSEPAPSKVVELIYRKLIQAAEDANAAAELCGL